MTEVFEHNPGDHEDPVPGSTWVVGLVGAVVLVIILLGLTALYYGSAEEEYTLRHSASAPRQLAQLRAAQTRILENWVRDAEDTRYGMPIDRAMQLYLDEARAAQARAFPRPPYGGDGP